MADKLVIQNFKYGLDARRDEIVAQPGTLITLDNGHINQGSEIEKRKAFVLQNFIGILDNNGDLGIMKWGESTDVGVTVFGSAIPFGGTVTQGQPLLVSDPTGVGVTYMQLQHPAVVDGSNYDRNNYRMTNVVWSTVFKGKAFVIAKFADGKSFLYYDGELVQQSRNGIVLTGRTSLANLGTELAREFNAIDGWSSSVNGDTLAGGIALPTLAMTGGGSGATITPVASNGIMITAAVSAAGTGYAVGDLVLVNNGMVLKVATLAGSGIATVTIQYGGIGTVNGLDVVKSPVGTSFGPIPSKNTVNGLLNTSFMDTDGSVKVYGEVDTNAPSFGSVAAQVAFTLTGTNGHITVVAPATASAALPTVNLATAVAFNTNLNKTASDVAGAINQGTMFHGYSASATGASAVVTVIAPASFGNFTLNLTVTNVDGDLNSAAGAAASGLAISLTPGTIVKSRVGSGSAAMNQTEAAAVSGGTGPYTYQWAEQSPGSGGGVICSGGAADTTTGVFAKATATVSFAKVLTKGASVTALLKCTVTDSTGATAIANFSITLENNSNL